MFTRSHAFNTGWPGVTLGAFLSRTQKALRLCFQDPVTSLQQAPRQRKPGAHSPENEKVVSIGADPVALASGQSEKGQAGSAAWRHVPVTVTPTGHTEANPAQHSVIRTSEIGRRATEAKARDHRSDSGSLPLLL